MEGNNEILITVFTPVFNRAELIMRLYNSLNEQSKLNFEWLIVDDGSTDNTKQVVNNIIKKEDNFIIRYYYKCNGGKHTAINYGVSKAKGKLFFIVDSDDYLISNAIEKITNWEKTISKCNEFCGLGFCKGVDNLTIVGSTFTNENGYLDSTSLDREKYNICGDKAEVYYTEILKKYPFPEFKNEKFLTEAVVWDRIANDGYKIRWINEIIYICEYLENGLSFNWNENLRNSPKGYALFVRQKIHFNNLPNNKIFFLAKNYHDNMSSYSVWKTCRILKINFFIYVLNNFVFIVKRTCRTLLLFFKSIFIISLFNLVTRNRKVSIISQNCLGGLLYHDIKMKFYSPTINLFFSSDDFIKFVLNLDYYLSLDLKFESNPTYPIAALDDITIHFLHYKNKQEALNFWEKRKKRINKNDVLVLMTDRDNFNQNSFNQFDKIKYNKLLFTCNEKYKKDKCVSFISKYKKLDCLPNCFLERKDYLTFELLKVLYFSSKGGKYD